MATTLGSVAALAATLAMAATALPATAATFVYVGCTDSNEITSCSLTHRAATSRRSRKWTIRHHQDGGLDADGHKPGQEIPVRRHARRADGGGELPHRSRDRQAQPHRQRPARWQHGLYRHRPQRPLPARRLLSQQQGHGEIRSHPTARCSRRSRSSRPSPTPTPSSPTPPIASCWQPASAAISCSSSASMPRPERLSPNDPPAAPGERMPVHAPRVPSDQWTGLPAERARSDGLRLRL